MRIKLNGTILESRNPLVIEQWKKAGYKEFKEKQQKAPDNGSEAPEEAEKALD